MAHSPKPFYRTGRGWYVQLGKSQVKLCGGEKTAAAEKEAWAAFHRLMAGGGPSEAGDKSANSAAGLSVAGLYEKYLDWCQRHREPGTYGWYLERVQSFAESLPSPKQTAATDLKPFHVIEWVDRHPAWNATSRRGAIIAVQRPYNWAFKLGYIPANPLQHVEKPKAKRREQAVSPAEFGEIVGHYAEGDPFRLLLTFSWETGVRPQEVTRVEARHVDLECLLVAFPPSEAKGKKRVRRVLLTEAAAAILRPLIGRFPDGPLFRNSDGRPWHRYALNNRFCRLKEKLGVKYATVSFRHGFCQKMLESGADHLTVAELMGHVDGSMVSKVYSHMNKAEKHLRDTLKKGSQK